MLDTIQIRKHVQFRAPLIFLGEKYVNIVDLEISRVKYIEIRCVYLL